MLFLIANWYERCGDFFWSRGSRDIDCDFPFVSGLTPLVSKEVDGKVGRGFKKFSFLEEKGTVS